MSNEKNDKKKTMSSQKFYMILLTDCYKKSLLVMKNFSLWPLCNANDIQIFP